MKLPLWRFITGSAVLAIMLFLVIAAGHVYVNNFLLDRYMKSLAATPDSARLSDAELSQKILDRARQLDLPLQSGYVTVVRSGGNPHIRIARYSVQMSLARMDLRMPGAESR